MDAVVLVIDFDQHAPVAIQVLDRGMSVLSETAACRTLAEGVALVEAADLAAMVHERAHWRARTPATYYCTHSLAPVAAVTGTRPVEVSGFVVPTTSGPEALERARQGRG